MTDARDRTPRTFWADRWRFASQQISEQFRPSLKDLFTDSVQLTLTAIFALLLFGFAHSSGHAQGYVAAAGTTIVVFLFKRLAGMVLFAHNYLIAPVAMWKRDQKRIADLQALFVPSLRLEFSEEDCRTWLPAGRVEESIGGKRWIDTKRTDEHILISCVNASEVRIEEVELYATLLRFTPDGQDEVALLRFLDPMRIRPLSDDVDISSMPAHGRRRFSVLLRASDYDPPRLNGRALTLAYERQFEKPGTYEIGVEAHGRDTSVAKAVLILELRAKEVADATGRKHPRYDIVSVRQREDCEPLLWRRASSQQP